MLSATSILDRLEQSPSSASLFVSLFVIKRSRCWTLDMPRRGHTLLLRELLFLSLLPPRTEEDRISLRTQVLQHQPDILEKYHKSQFTRTRGGGCISRWANSSIFIFVPGLWGCDSGLPLLSVFSMMFGYLHVSLSMRIVMFNFSPLNSEIYFACSYKNKVYIDLSKLR